MSMPRDLARPSIIWVSLASITISQKVNAIVRSNSNIALHLIIPPWLFSYQAFFLNTEKDFVSRPHTHYQCLHFKLCLFTRVHQIDIWPPQRWLVHWINHLCPTHCSTYEKPNRATMVYRGWLDVFVPVRMPARPPPLAAPPPPPPPQTFVHAIRFEQLFGFFSFWQGWWPWPIYNLIRFWSISVMTLTLNFQRQIWNLLYLSQNDPIATKRNRNISMQH